MARFTLRALLAALVFALCPFASVALPGDAAAVLAHCGPPSSDRIMATSGGTHERVITYTDIALHFRPDSGDWSFNSATDASRPMSGTDVSSSLHCFGDALEEVAARPPITFGTPAQTSSDTPQANDSYNVLFGIFGTVIVVGILFFAIRPYMKSEQVQRPAETPRAPQRRPSAARLAVRPTTDSSLNNPIAPPTRPHNPPSSGSRRSYYEPLESKEPQS